AWTILSRARYASRALPSTSAATPVDVTSLALTTPVPTDPALYLRMYLGTDTQLFLMTLVIMLVIWRWPRSGVPVLSIVMAVSLLIPFLQSYFMNLMPIRVSIFPEDLRRCSGMGSIAASGSSVILCYVATRYGFEDLWRTDEKKLLCH
ncbi:Acyltransferase OPGC1, partial [Operophtera brumata]